MGKQRSLTIGLITVISAFYLWELIDPAVLGTFALMGTGMLKANHEWYRLITVALVHDNSSFIPIHLAFNMMALHSLGTPVERFLGKARYSIVFLVSLLSASIYSAMNLGWNGYSIGASGAVFGLFGAFVVIGRRIGVDVRSTYAIIAINFAIGFTIGGVDWHAHLGGLVGGAITTKLLLSLNASK